ncbi:ebh [Symbiodinium sp. CCMP2592]|nr:ebh [Symbiodinium sp. CCMP2592]
MHRTPQSFSTGALPGISKKGPFRKDGLHQSGNWVIAHKGHGISPGSTRGSWQVPSSPTEAMIASWPRWAIPGFLEQIPPRLEGCRQRLLAAEIELRRAEKAGGLEVGNASTPQEEAETKSVVQDLPILKAPEETTDEYADMPQEAVWILDQVGELEGQFTELNSKLQELEVSHATARKLKSQYAEDAGTCFAAMIELSSRVTALTEQLKASQGTAGALRGKLGQAIGNTQRLQKQVAEGHSVAMRLKEKLASARAIAERYKGDWEAVTEDHTQLRAQHESLSNAKFVLEKDAAAHKGQLAKADASQVELRGELDRAEERIETLAAESKAKDASLRELQSALASEKEAALKALPPPPDPMAIRTEAATVARLVVKDWLRTAAPEPTPTEPPPAEPTPMDFAAAQASSAELAELRAQLQDLQLAKEAASSDASSLRAQLEQEKAAALQLAEAAREKEASLLKLSEESREKDQTIQKLADAAQEKDVSLQKLSSDSREKDATIQELQEALELQKERARSQADASEDDLRKELARVEEQLDELAKQGREKDAALQQLQEMAEAEKADAQSKAEASEAQLAAERKRAEEQLEQITGESKAKDASLEQLSADMEALKAKAQEDHAQAAASQEELRGELSRAVDELEQVSSQSREKDALIQQLQAASEAEMATAHSNAEADAGREQLSGEVSRLNAELEQAATAKKEQDASLQRLQAELDASAKTQSEADAQGEQMKGEIARLEDDNSEKDFACEIFHRFPPCCVAISWLELTDASMDPTSGAVEVVAATDDTEGAGSDDNAGDDERYAKAESVSDNIPKMSADRHTDMEEMIVGVLSRMKPVRPDIVRAVRAGRVTFCCGRALRSSRRRRPGGFQTSFQTGKIDEFWSHSWHGSRWSKIVTVTYLNNGLIAPLIASVCAMISASLFVAGVLPMAFFEATQKPPYIAQYPLVSYWSKATGFAVYCFVLLLWQRRKGIFLDTLCIKQDDNKWKALALLSMPALLKSSDSLLVLWDPTYTRRLWCCFEIAAFLHSRPPGQKPKIRVRPTLLGVGFISMLVALASLLLALAFVPAGEDKELARLEVMWPLMAGCSFVAFYFSVMKLREFFRFVEMMESELQQFRLDSCSCQCCDTNHKYSQTCDRRILKICITKWFGSIDLFEDLMRSEVLACLTEQLATSILTYREFVVMSLPIFWHHLDTASEPLDWFLRPTSGHTAYLHRELKALAREVLRGIGWSFAALPILFLVTSRLSCLLRRRIGQSNAAKICWDVLIICGILLVAISLFVAFLVLEQLCTLELPGPVVFDAILFACAFLLFRVLPVPMRLKAQAGQEHEGHGADISASPGEMEVSEPAERTHIQL